MPGREGGVLALHPGTREGRRMNEWIEGSPPGDNRSIPPGTLIQLKQDGEIILVGHCSPRGGGCNCCSYFDRSDEVARYKIVWTE